MSAAAVLALLTGLTGGELVAGHRDASIEIDGEVLDARFVDVEPDGRPELVLVVRPSGAQRRELRLYALDARGGLERTPSFSVPVLEDVTAYGFADVRAERGRELLFLARSGVWSLSTKVSGLRDNVQRLIAADLVFDVPDPGAIAYWDYVLVGGGTARDVVVAPGHYSFSLWGPADGFTDGLTDGLTDGPAEGESAYRSLLDFADVINAGSPDEATSVVVRQSATLSVAGSGLAVDRDDADGSRLMIDDSGRMRRSLLSFRRKYRAPALGDLDGDGRTDLVVLHEETLRVHIATDAGIPREPTRIEPVPDYLGEDPSGELVDVNGDGDADLVSLRSTKGEESAFVSKVYTLVVALNDGKRLLPERPSQLMRFEAMEMRTEIADVDGDGVRDLVVRKFDVPTLVDVVTSLDFTHTTLLYLGTGGKDGRVFGRRPVLKHEKLYDEDSVQGAIASRNLTWDVSGDGVADLVEVDAHGAVGVRRLVHTSSFFRGDRWELDDDPWQRFDGEGSITSLVVDDFDGDGLGDVLSRRRNGVLVLLSGGAGGAR